MSMTRGLIVTTLLMSVLLTACHKAFAQPAGFYPTVPAGASGAPVDAQYVVLSDTANLTNPRTLAVTGGLTKTDNGAHNAITLGITNSIANGLTSATTRAGALNALMPGSTATGDLVYFDGANWVRLPIGTSGQYLSTSAGIPAWTSAASGAPSSSAFITVGNDAGLSAERAITAGTGITGTDGGANSTYTLAVDTAVVATTSNSLTMSNKTLTNPIMAWNTGSGFRLAGSAFTSSLVWADWLAARTITIPEPGANASVVLTQGNQTLAGVTTFSQAPILSSGTLIVGGQTITLPTATDTLVSLNAAQTLTSKTLTSPQVGTSLILDQTTGNYTISWDNPAAARAIRIQDMGTSADILMKAQSQAMTAGGVMYADGTKAAVTAQGSTGQFLKSNGSSAPTWSTSSPAYFGGDGSFGALSITSIAATNVIQVNATTVQVNGSFVSYTLGSGSVINASGSVQVGPTSTSSISANQGPAGGAVATATLLASDGAGSAPGMGSAATTGSAFAGGGGGCSGNGGNSSHVYGGRGVGTSQIPYAGSGGGGGQSSAGGAGGGRLTICAAGAITVSAGCSISALGAAGGGGTNSGGAGSGGVIYLCSQTSITTPGTISAAGGAGAGTNGAGGGGGTVVIWSPSNSIGTVTLTGGSGVGTGTSGGTGQEFLISGTPNLPLMSWMQKHEEQIAALPCHNLHNRDVAALAAKNISEFFALSSDSLTETCVGVGEVLEVSNRV